MSDPLHNLTFTSVPANTPTQPQFNNQNFLQMTQQIYQNPAGFEQLVKQQYPDVYNRAMQIRNSANPKQATLQMAQSLGVNPNILRMFGL